jgi:hypothetical protein
VVPRARLAPAAHGGGVKLPWWMREVPCAGRGNGAVFAFRVHPLYRWWLCAVAVWTVLRAVRIEVGFRVRGDDP